MPFYLSYAAFTFPLSSAIAAKQTMACAAKLGHPLPGAFGFVLGNCDCGSPGGCTYIRFMMFLTAKINNPILFTKAVKSELKATWLHRFKLNTAFHLSSE